jgi:hypothetical protein
MNGALGAHAASVATAPSATNPGTRAPRRIKDRTGQRALPVSKRALIALNLPEDFTPTSNLESVMKEIPGTPGLTYKVLRCSADPIAKSLIKLYDDLTPQERKVVTLDHLVSAAAVEPQEVLKMIAGELYSYGSQVANMLAAASSPDVMRKSISFAKKKEGFHHARMILQTSGVAPVPKTQVTNLRLQQNVQNNTVNNLEIARLEDVVKCIDALEE